MPQSTVKYRFELEILGWASQFSQMMTAESRGFFISMRLDGTVQKVFFGERPGHFDLALKESLAKTSQSWLFYHPFEAPEHTWIEWQDVQRSTIERLLGQQFEGSDFFGFYPEDKLTDFPDSWQVMF